MKLQIFAVMDTATQWYGTPLFQNTRAQAVRSFTDEVNRKERGNPWNEHPEDHNLYHIGEYDPNAGELTPRKPELVVRGIDCVKPTNQEVHQ